MKILRLAKDMGEDLGVFDEMRKTAELVGLMSGVRGRQPDGGRKPCLAEESGHGAPADAVGEGLFMMHGPNGFL